MIKTFRGKLVDGGQERIRLSTIQGKVGYRIIKFKLLPAAPGTTDYESVVKIFKTEQSSVSGTIDFTDPTLLAAGYIEGRLTPETTDSHHVIFENEIVNQDIYVTHDDLDAGEECNYYIEMEQIQLTDKSAEYSTIKDLRQYTRPVIV